MKRRFPLMAKVATWLALHLLALAAVFAVFVGWQLRLGLDSLLSGATGERLESLGREISGSLSEAPQDEWEDVIAGKIAPYGLKGYLRTERDLGHDKEEAGIPEEIMLRAKKELPPPGGRGGPPRHGEGGRPPRAGGPDDFFPPEERRPREERQPSALFLTRDSGSGKYWAAIELAIESPGGAGRHAACFS